MKKMSQKNWIIILTLALVASLVANVVGYNSSNGKLKDYLNQQYSQVLSDYERSILSTSDSILSTLQNAIDKKMISKEELLLLYKSYEQLNQNQNQYASYVQIYNSPDGKKLSLWTRMNLLLLIIFLVLSTLIQAKLCLKNFFCKANQLLT